MEKIKLRFISPVSLETKARIETELEILDGVKSAEVDAATGEGQVEYDRNIISPEEIFKVAAGLGQQTLIKEQTKDGGHNSREHTFFVKGMHCASCEILIEKQLLKTKGIKSVEASTGKGEVLVEYDGRRPSKEDLDRLFKDEGYVFFDQPFKQMAEAKGGIYKSIVIVGAVVAIFAILNKLGIGSLVNITSKSSLPALFALGLLAGISSCAALVGGIVLSMSKQWLSLYQTNDSFLKKLQPHLMFNAGRLISYGLLGAVLGGVGAKLQISFGFTSVLVIVVSFLMFILGAQMLGVKALGRFQITMPKFVTRRVADESKFQGRYMPFTLGALTFFLPCGFTITAQGLALLSGSAWQGGLIMFLFALGTAPALFLIGFSSVRFFSKPHLADTFLKAAGALVIFFALFNINAQLNVLGMPSFSNVFNKTGLSAPAGLSQQISEADLPPIVGGKQVVKMNASSYGYSPNNFKVRAGVPVRWEITDTGTSGCTNAIISRGLFDGEIGLTPGQTSIKEFTPAKAGKYKFSCWMGMISGTIEVVDVKAVVKNAGTLTQAANAASAGDNNIIPSGAKGCGCGGGGGSCGTR
ncbi:MAG: sulfite exporter TauE/SafE family protein [bacterium]|nr:sulfite exporter TauE/SafE family protein [bacterium]